MTLGEMLDRMSAAEFAAWMRYANLEPFGERRADARAALVAMIVNNRMRGENEQGRPFEDFLLPTGEAPTLARPSPAELRAKLRVVFRHPDAIQGAV